MIRIFIAHSKEDNWFIDPICANLETIPVEPYRARLEDPTPMPLSRKLDLAIKGSNAMFVFLTKNVMMLRDTWDIINWEIATAYAYKKPVYVFREKGVEVPLMIKYITVYFTYDPFDQKSLNETLLHAKSIASNLKESEDKAKAAAILVLFLLGLGFLGALGGE